jgi:hypothetical protein
MTWRNQHGGNMDKKHRVKRRWQIRDNFGLADFFDIGDTFRLVPNTTAGGPTFFWIRFKNKDPKKSKLWKGRYVYPVGMKSPKTSLKHAWDDTKSPGAQAKGVKSDFDREGKHLRSIADNPNTARLEGHILFDSHWAIIRIFCFSKAQSDKKDWFAIDSSYRNPGTLQDGTAHGDPPH